MNDKTLGFIETFGFVPAIESADTALKTADVELVGLKLVSGGLVTVIVSGDTSSVNASMDAAKKAAEQLGKVNSVTVIARTGNGLTTALIPTIPRNTNAQSDTDKSKNTQQKLVIDSVALDKMKVTELRQIARQLDGLSILRKEIKFAKKDELIQAIIATVHE